MELQETIADIEACRSLAELQDTLQKIAENLGFAAFDFIDAGQPHLDLPFHIGTSGAAWEREYISNNFVQVDPCIARVRRTNLPFVWSDIKADEPHHGPKNGARRTMEAARDHGFQEGFVVPFHFRDPLGRLCSSSSVFFWKDRVQQFRFLLGERRHELHIIMIYWVQRAIDIVSVERRGAGPMFRTDAGLNGGVGLSDREREVLAWAARGKTTSDTADIINVSTDTAETHIRNAMRKLDATNKTHAVTKAIYLGLIDV